jgi:hypothetical protein
MGPHSLDGPLQENLPVRKLHECPSTVFPFLKGEEIRCLAEFDPQCGRVALNT